MTHERTKIPANQGWQVWWKLLRPHTLTAAFVPVATGTALALPTAQVRPALFLVMLLSSLLIQAATNMCNEYYDYVKGLDTEESVGIGGTIVRDGVAASTVLRIALSFYALAALGGVYICANSSWWVAVVGLFCMAVGYLYTGGPFPIAYTPFGELLSGILMGLIIIQITFFIQTGNITYASILISIPISVLIGNIMLANNIRDLEGDKVKGRHTLPILLGKERAVILLGTMFIFCFIWLFALVILKIITAWSLLALAGLPKAQKAVKSFLGAESILDMMSAMQATAQTNTVYGLSLALGLVIGYFW